MRPPEFTPDESFAIQSASSRGWSSYLAFDLAYLIPSFALLVIALRTCSGLAVFVAMFLIAGFKAWDWNTQRRYIPVWRSILAKYEEALREGGPASPPDA